MMTAIAIAIAYLLGSISSAIIVCKLAKQPDPRTGGSGNPGASNVLRTAGKVYAAMTLLGDVLKGFVAVLIALLLGIHGFWLGFVALAAVVGHMYPVFFGFKGGKGVATAFGCFFAMAYPIGIAAVVVWAVLIFIFRYASLSSLTACLLAPFISLMIHPTYFVGLALIAILIVYRHWANIARLRNGTESKFVFNGANSSDEDTEKPEEPSEKSKGKEQEK